MNPRPADDGHDLTADWADFETLALRRDRMAVAAVIRRMCEYTPPPLIVAHVAMFVAAQIVHNGGPAPDAFRYVRDPRRRTARDDAYQLISLFIDPTSAGTHAAQLLAYEITGDPSGWRFSAVVTELLDQLPPTPDDVIGPARGHVVMPGNGDAGR